MLHQDKTIIIIQIANRVNQPVHQSPYPGAAGDCHRSGLGSLSSYVWITPEQTAHHPH